MTDEEEKQPDSNENQGGTGCLEAFMYIFVGIILVSLLVFGLCVAGI